MTLIFISAPTGDPKTPGSDPVELCDAGDHVGSLLVLQLGIDRNRQGFRGRLLALGEIAGTIA